MSEAAGLATAPGPASRYRESLRLNPGRFPADQMEMLPMAPAARPRLGLAGILLLALLLRLIYLGQVASLPFFDHPVGESQVHLTLASQIAAGSFVPHRPFFYASVLYPYFLAVVLEISRGRILGVALVQVLAGVLLVYLVYRLGARIYGSSAGLWAAALAALYGPFAFFEADVVGVPTPGVVCVVPVTPPTELGIETS